MQTPLMRARRLPPQSSPLPFAGKPIAPAFPHDELAVVALGGGQEQLATSACTAALVGARRLADPQQGGKRQRSRLAALFLSGLISIGAISVAVPVAAAPIEQQEATDPYAAPVTEASQRFGIPAAWIRAVMHVESRGDRRAISLKGAIGLMQIMPDTWADLRDRYGFGRDPFDPHDNILAGAAYLREMHDRYGSPGFLAAYNAGPARYEDYRDRHRPLPSETVAYVAALAPFVGDGAILGPVLEAAIDPSSWMQAPLFAMHADSAPNADHAAQNEPPRDAGTAVSVRDLSAIVPQSGDLFVARSGAVRSH